MYEYTVVEVRPRTISKALSAASLELVLNEHASEGWRLAAVTSGSVKGPLGPVEGLLVTLERELR